MDLRTRTSLFCGAVALAIAISILLQGRLRRPQALAAALAADMGLWYLVQWLYQWNLIPTDFYYASLTSWVVAYLEVTRRLKALYR